MFNLIKILSGFIILTGVLHISNTFKTYSHVYNPEFVVLGASIICSGIINIFIIYKGGSKFHFIGGFICNAIISLLLCYELSKIDQLPIYIDLLFFQIIMISFSVLIARQDIVKKQI